MGPTSQFFNVRNSAAAASDPLVSNIIPFVSNCPRCMRPQAQGGFTRSALRRLLQHGYPIEAYCDMCDQFWPVNAQQRVHLARAVEMEASPEIPHID